MLVWVGSEVDPSTQAARVGSIYVETVPVDPNVGNSPQFAALVEAPDHSKSLSIVSLTGSTLTVSSSSGGRFDFDLSKNAFI